MGLGLFLGKDKKQNISVTKQGIPENPESSVTKC